MTSMIDSPVVLVEQRSETVIERYHMGIGGNEAVCIACEGGQHGDNTVLKDQLCSCPCHNN